MERLSHGVGCDFYNMFLHIWIKTMKTLKGLNNPYDERSAPQQQHIYCHALVK